MHTRLSIFIDYATKGNKAEFARAIGVRPQLLTKLLQGTAFGVTAINAILRAYPELNARWLLLGEGGMLRGAESSLKQRLLRLLELECYLPVMTGEEQERIIAGDTDFDRATIAKWHRLLHERNDEMQARFEAAFSRQKQWLEEGAK